MLRRAALALSVVASLPMVLPLIRSAVINTCRIHVKTARCVSTSISWRVREIVESSGALRQGPAQKAAERKGIGGAPRAPTLGIDAFEVANQQQPELRPRRQTRAADRRRVERRTLRFDVRVTRMPVEYLIQWKKSLAGLTPAHYTETLATERSTVTAGL